VGIAPMRSEASHRAEQISQVLFGECVEILENGPGSWQRVRSIFDNYEGWCQSVQFTPVQKANVARGAKWYATAPDNRIITEAGAAVPVPPGSALWPLKSGRIVLGDMQGTFRGKKKSVANLIYSPEAVSKWALMYMGAPYLWGGRTPAGIDCSGLAQMVGRFCGTALPRDAWQQAEQGEEVSFLEMVQPGDLAFFDNDAGRIVHVGILLSENSIVHATETAGRVVMDKIDAGGIISISMRKRTHRLRVIRRITAGAPGIKREKNVLF
jgi:cell wall-associated NlpC family hydrolase